MTGTGGWVGGGGVGEQNTDRRDKWGRVVRNSSVVGMLSLGVNVESSLQARVSADCC